MSGKQAAIMLLGCVMILLLVGWWLEGFRQKKMIDDFKRMLEDLPTHIKGEGTP